MQVKDAKPCQIFETIAFGKPTGRLYAISLGLQDRPGSVRCFDRNQTVVYLDPETECNKVGDTRFNIPAGYRSDGYRHFHGV